MADSQQNRQDKMVTYGKWSTPLPEEGRFNIDVNAPKPPKPRNLKTAFKLALFLGLVGGCDFYLGHTGKGFIKIVTLIPTCIYFVVGDDEGSRITGLIFSMILLVWYLADIVRIWRAKRGHTVIYDEWSNRVK